jgi:hypothetical protein
VQIPGPLTTANTSLQPRLDTTGAGKATVVRCTGSKYFYTYL